MYLLSSLAYAYALARYGGVSWHGFSQHLMPWQKMARGCSQLLDRALAFCFAIMLAYAYALARYGGVSWHGFSQHLMPWQKMARGCSQLLDRALAFCFAIMLVFTANIRVGAALQMALGLRSQSCLPLPSANIRVGAALQMALGLRSQSCLPLPLEAKICTYSQAQLMPTLQLGMVASMAKDDKGLLLCAGQSIGFLLCHYACDCG